jgi:hypothetical protein
VIRPGDRWVLGHVIDRWRGGTDDRLAPEHARCSAESGARAAAASRRLRRAAAEAGRVVPASASTLRGRVARSRRAARECGPSRQW